MYDYGNYYSDVEDSFISYYLHECFNSYAEAVTAAEKKKTKKIKSLELQLEKVRALKFEGAE